MNEFYLIDASGKPKTISEQVYKTFMTMFEEWKNEYGGCLSCSCKGVGDYLVTTTEYKRDFFSLEIKKVITFKEAV